MDGENKGRIVRNRELDRMLRDAISDGVAEMKTFRNVAELLRMTEAAEKARDDRGRKISAYA